jgi:hypothetical protein
MVPVYVPEFHTWVVVIAHSSPRTLAAPVATVGASKYPSFTHEAVSPAGVLIDETAGRVPLLPAKLSTANATTSVFPEATFAESANVQSVSAVLSVPPVWD